MFTFSADPFFFLYHTIININIYILYYILSNIIIITYFLKVRKCAYKFTLNCVFARTLNESCYLFIRNFKYKIQEEKLNVIKGPERLINQHCVQEQRHPDHTVCYSVKCTFLPFLFPSLRRFLCKSKDRIYATRTKKHHNAYIWHIHRLQQ